MVQEIMNQISYILNTIMNKILEVILIKLWQLAIETLLILLTYFLVTLGGAWIILGLFVGLFAFINLVAILVQTVKHTN
jgi:hypothetical protein